MSANLGNEGQANLGTDRTMHTVIQGEGTALLMLHGLTGSNLNWNSLISDRKDTHRCIAMDFIGHGRSPAPTDPASYRPEAIFGDIKKQLQAHGDGQGILCGLSMGAAAALLYALEHPDDVNALILSSFPPAKTDRGISAIAREFSDDILKLGLDAAYEKHICHDNSPFREQDRQLIKMGFQMHKHEHGPALCLGEFLSNIPEQDDLLERAAQLSIPTLIIAGSKDDGSLRYSKKLAEAMPKESSRLKIIENGGHLVNLDSAKEYNRLVAEFTQSI